MLKILTDSTCDLPQETVDSLGIEVLPLYINIGDKGYLDGVEISRKDFYDNLPNYETHPTTGTPGIDAFLAKFQALVKEGASEILTIHISEALSATVNIARMAAEKFTEVPVTVWDSQQLSMGTGFQVELAAQEARAGTQLEQILIKLESLAKRTFVAAGLNTLEYLRRSGRMNRFMSGLGSLIQLKPILTMENGLPGSARVRTESKAFDYLVQLVDENQPFEKFAFLHTNHLVGIERLREKIIKMLPSGDFISTNITPVIGSHVGPGAVGFAYVRKEIE